MSHILMSCHFVTYLFCEITDPECPSRVLIYKSGSLEEFPVEAINVGENCRGFSYLYISTGFILT
jgi:hypothetical protein